MSFKLWVCRYFSWLFTNRWFRISNTESIKPGSIVIVRGGSRRKYTVVYIVASAVQAAELKKGESSRFFYVLYFGDFDLKHYPTPDMVFTTDMGIEAYTDGKMNATARSYLFPGEVSPEHLKEMIIAVKDRWEGIIRSNPHLRSLESPFL